MLDTAPVAGDVTNAAPAVSTETRPVRMLVRTHRDNDLYLPESDTLRAADLGISRHTTDAQLLAIREQLGDDCRTVFPGVDADAVLAEMTWLRDCLAQPRDITEARAWGLDIPNNELENWQETKPGQELDWWWVYDPNRQETRDQRKARYMHDRRLVDTKGLARILCRSYPTVKSLKSVTEAARTSLDHAEQLHALAETFVAQNPALTIEEATAILRADAEQVVSKGTPKIAFSYPKVDLFYANEAFRNGNDTTRLNSWFEFNKLPQTGRPPGSKTTRTRRTGN
jgi:hypothetical protein